LSSIATFPHTSSIPVPTPTPVSSEKAIDMVTGFDFFAHPGLWFLFGCLFVILAVSLIEYFGRGKGRKA